MVGRRHGLAGWTLVLALVHAASAQAWLPLTSIEDSARKGFDCHDVRSFEPLDSPALCSVQGGVVALKGSAQCHYNVLGCFTAGAAFATLPPACRPSSEQTVVAGTQEAVSGRAYTKFIYGATIHVGTDGTLMVAEIPDTTDPQWLLSLEGVKIPAGGSDWGTRFLLVVAVASLLYVGAGVALGSLQGRALGLRAHQHYGLWMSVRALVLDGVARAGLRQKPHVIIGSGARYKGAAKKCSKSSSSSSSRSHSKVLSSIKKEHRDSERQHSLLGVANTSSPSTTAAGPGVGSSVEWRPTQTGFLSVGGRETGVKTQSRSNVT